MHHRFLHVQFSSVNQGLSEVDKCRYLMVLIANYISYTAAVTSYLIAHPLIASQTFLGLVTNSRRPTLHLHPSTSNIRRQPRLSTLSLPRSQLFRQTDISSPPSSPTSTSRYAVVLLQARVQYPHHREIQLR